MQENLKIATHNSATGEESFWLSLPLVPFARTQSKTILQQWASGCNMFDLRAKYAFGKWRAAHGLWFSKKSMEEILYQLNSYAATGKIYVFLTYEGRVDNAEDFIPQALLWKNKYQNIIWGDICAKYKDKGIKVDYSEPLIKGDPKCEGGKQAFLPLNGKTWHTFIPIPWLWKQFYFKHVEFNRDYYQFVDFL